MKTNKETRRVNTRMYGNLAFMILDRMHGDLGKYLWYVDVRRDVDDMVYFEVSTRKVSYPSRDCPQNPFLEKDDAHVLSWLGNRLKRLASEEAAYGKWPDGWWNRTNDVRLTWLCGDGDVTVADAYKVYEELKGLTKNANDPRIFGKAASRETVEDRKAKAKAKAAAKAEYAKEIAKLRVEREKFEKALNAKRDAVWKKFYNKVFKIDPDDKSYAFAATSEDV